MTRKEMRDQAIAQLERISKNLASIGEEEDWTDFIIQELEQETVSKESYDHEYFLRKEFEIKIDKLQRQLEQIRAEIENDWQLKKYPSSPFSCGLRRAIEIIDKYKVKSED